MDNFTCNPSYRTSLIDSIMVLKPVVYESLLASMIQQHPEDFVNMTKEVEILIDHLQHVKLTGAKSFNSIRDNRANADTYFKSITDSMKDVSDITMLKTIHIEIAFENKDLLQKTLEYIDDNPEIFTSKEIIVNELSRTFHISEDLAQSYLILQNAKKNFHLRKNKKA